MSISRRFLIASSLARLIQREKGGVRILEGYFPDHNGKTSCVQLLETSAFLTLKTQSTSGVTAERVEIPRSYAEALLDVVAGEVDIVRTTLAVDQREISVNRVIAPSRLDLISVEFENLAEAPAFSPLPWFGPEVTADRRFSLQAMAFAGPAEVLEVPCTDVALHSLIDTLEGRAKPVKQQPHSASQNPGPSRKSSAARTGAARPSAEVANTGAATHEQALLRELERAVHPQLGPPSLRTY
ncbi:CYTH domain-containing protein [Microvirga roseola]|uniref:hypothetical protein n=1 Tax=Microvirga roseola TaxID=2883126 RepID=UPI001E527FD2|nr:hypothetical protein [Microvirga roseola]